MQRFFGEVQRWLEKALLRQGATIIAACGEAELTSRLVKRSRLLERAGVNHLAIFALAEAAVDFGVNVHTARNGS